VNLQCLSPKVEVKEKFGKPVSIFDPFFLDSGYKKERHIEKVSRLG
jgi:hypothetical protein